MKAETVLKAEMVMETEMVMGEIMQKGECSYNKGAAIDVDGKDAVLDVDSMVNFMEEKLASTRGKPSYRSTIFTVPKDIRNNDAAAYSPKVVSIGLLQQEKRRLDEHKWHYLDKVLSRSKNNLKIYIKEMEKIVVEAGLCYSGCPEPEDMLEWWFKESVEMMLVDGCFIINLLLQLEDGLVEINDPIYSERWTLPWVGHDMLLLENQLPFFVLEKLWELTGRERPTVKRKVLQFFRNLLPEEHDLMLPKIEHVQHLLHLIHLSLQPALPSKKPESTSGTTIPGPPQPGDTLSSTKNYSSESPESLHPTSPAMTSQPVNLPRLHVRANLMLHDPTSSGLKQTPPGLKQIPRDQQIKPESTGGTTIPHPPQPSDTLSSTKNSSFESPKPLQPAFSTEKPESASGATIPSPPQPSDTLSTSKSSPFKSTESLQPTSPAMISQPVKRRYKRSALSPHDEFPIPSGLEQIPRGLKEIPKGLKQIPRAQQIKQMSEPRPAPPPKTIPSATELQEAGVKLQRRRARSFLDVTFEQGLMQIPRLTISDSTNSLFRNFIAFEQGFPDCGNHFTSYCIFMDSLINTPRDVEILKQSGIIEHVSGSDEEVALLFNKFSRGITWDFKGSYLAKVFEDVNQHTQKRWPKWRANLVRDYFSNPWAILSLIAAIVILILTFLQTYFGVFAYFRPP
ncbi:hypothetical protein AAC387_Pa02g0132 [Persea americana]